MPQNYVPIFTFAFVAFLVAAGRWGFFTSSVEKTQRHQADAV